MNTTENQASLSAAIHAIYQNRRMRTIVNEAKMLVAGRHDAHSHESHLDFVFNEWLIAQTDERRNEVKGQVEEYIRILNDMIDRELLAVSGNNLESSSLVDLRLPVYGHEEDLPSPLPPFALDPTRPVTPLDQVTPASAEPPPAPRKKKAGSLPLSPPPTPLLMALDGLAASRSGNIDNDTFHIALDYLIEAMEHAEGRQAKMDAYIRIFEFILTQPTNLLKDPTLRELAYESLKSTNLRIPGHTGVELLIQTFDRLFVTLRSHPYYVPHLSGSY
jgi:hypothetical protein